MQVKVDEKLCSGHARCNALAPRVFPIDDLGFCALRGQGWTDVVTEFEVDAQSASFACPEDAIDVRP